MVPVLPKNLEEKKTTTRGGRGPVPTTNRRFWDGAGPPQTAGEDGRRYNTGSYLRGAHVALQDSRPPQTDRS